MYKISLKQEDLSAGEYEEFITFIDATTKEEALTQFKHQVPWGLYREAFNKGRMRIVKTC